MRICAQFAVAREAELSVISSARPAPPAPSCAVSLAVAVTARRSCAVALAARSATHIAWLKQLAEAEGREPPLRRRCTCHHMLSRGDLNGALRDRLARAALHRGQRGPRAADQEECPRRRRASASGHGGAVLRKLAAGDERGAVERRLERQTADVARLLTNGTNANARRATTGTSRRR